MPVAIKYHHFHEHIQNKTIHIQHVETKDQLAYIFTKPLAWDFFRNLRKRIIGW